MERSAQYQRTAQAADPEIFRADFVEQPILGRIGAGRLPERLPDGSRTGDQAELLTLAFQVV